MKLSENILRNNLKFIMLGEFWGALFVGDLLLILTLGVVEIDDWDVTTTLILCENNLLESLFDVIEPRRDRRSLTPIEW